ncbi:MAG: hypothetical protein H6881_08230 [Rhodobiaceae bacterium]|nr:hypothetical protein [Rhodobiaceae bacterium]MCC0051850.1 hypothetical protein [Rhodobiaceae bacterium]
MLDEALEHRTSQLYQTFDTFISGNLVTVGGRHDDSFMKLLEPEDEQVWEIRSISPKPSIRVFGRFAEPDVFVATNKGFRADLGGFGSVGFKRAMTTCLQEWRKCFQNWPAFTGRHFNDYITSGAVDLRDL